MVTEIDEYKNLSIDDYAFVNILKSLLETENFIAYNKHERYFPSATINSYIRFFNQDILAKDDNNDNKYNQANYTTTDDIESLKVPAFKPKEIGVRVVKETASQLRSQKEKNISLKRSNWKCEYNNNHLTFLNKYNNKQFLEAHHLIPTGHQSNYDVSLDIFTNIVILCPNCHRLIHHGRFKDAKPMLKYFYTERKQELKQSGINISLSELLTLYNF